MKMCDICSEAFSCLLDYNGKACANLRKEHCPEVVYSNANHISDMDEVQLAHFLAEWNERPLAWKQDAKGELLAWLREEY